MCKPKNAKLHDSCFIFTFEVLLETDLKVRISFCGLCIKYYQALSRPGIAVHVYLSASPRHIYVYVSLSVLAHVRGLVLQFLILPLNVLKIRKGIIIV